MGDYISKSRLSINYRSIWVTSVFLILYRIKSIFYGCLQHVYSKKWSTLNDYSPSLWPCSWRKRCWWDIWPQLSWKKKSVQVIQGREDTPIRCTPYLTPIICSATLHMIKCMAHTLLPVLEEMEGEGCLNVCLFNMSRVILNAHLDRKKTR